MLRLRLLVPLAACLVATVAACSRTRPPISAADEHFRVIVDYEDDRLPAPGLAAVAPVWDVVAAEWPGQTTPPAEPLAVYLYFHDGGYDEADARLTGGQRSLNRAFAHADSRTAHVDLQPRVDPALIPVHGLPPQTERMLAHEAAHLARYELARWRSNDPQWALDSAALHAAALVMHRRGRDGTIDDAPFTSTLLAIAQRLEPDGRCPPFSAVFDGDLSTPAGAALVHPEPYALAWAAWRYIQFDHAERLRDPASHADIDQDEAFSEWLRAQRPPWLEEGRGLATGKDAWQQCAFDDAPALAWRLDPAPPPYTLTGAVSFVTGDGPEDGTSADVRFSSRGDARILVRFWPLAGGERTRVSIRDDVSGEELEHVLTATRERLPFRIAVTPDRVTVAIAEEEPFHAVAGAELDGPWGLAVSPGGWVKWHGIAVER